MTDEDVQELVNRIQDAQNEWASGTVNSLFDFKSRDDLRSFRRSAL